MCTGSRASDETLRDLIENVDNGQLSTRHNEIVWKAGKAAWKIDGNHKPFPRGNLEAVVRFATGTVFGNLSTIPNTLKSMNQSLREKGGEMLNEYIEEHLDGGTYNVLQSVNRLRKQNGICRSIVRGHRQFIQRKMKEGKYSNPEVKDRANQFVKEVKKIEIALKKQNNLLLRQQIQAGFHIAMYDVRERLGRS